MIRGFEQPHRVEPLAKNHLQAIPAVTAGLIAGVILLVLPHASPWSGVTSFNPAIVGREPPAGWDMPAFAIIFLHLVLSMAYGFIISLYVMHFRELRAVFMGGVAGAVLYLLNFAVVAFFFPLMRGSETAVLLAHIVFGLIAAGVYRGLLRRLPATQDLPSPPVS
jgi:hypothetical protein